MCSPDLTRGVCLVCLGTLTPETTHVDRFGNTWDVHRGVCAMLAGEVPPIHQQTFSWYLERMANASTDRVRVAIRRAFDKWVRSVADENHYHVETFDELD